MTWHNARLTRFVAHLTHHTVGIAAGNIKELRRTSCLIMSTGCINHVTEVIKLMTQILYLLPSFCSSPSMWFLRINGTGGIEITIRFLCRRHNIEHTVYIGLQFLVGICLKHVARTFNSLIHIGIVERETHEFRHIILIAWVGGFNKIGIAPLTLTFAECQRYGNLSCGLDALSPE